MNNSDLYEKEHKFQRNDAIYYLNKYSYLLNMKSYGGDSLIDVGCGPGDVTVDLIKPLLPKNFSSMYGVDLSQQMIDHARKKYETDRIKFEQVNIEGDLPAKLHGMFDHGISIYCLHWIQNQEKAYQNVYKVLKPGGDFLFMFLANHPIYGSYRKVIAETKWKIYMEDAEKFISPFADSVKAEVDYEKVLKKQNFKNIKIFREEMNFKYFGRKSAKDNMKAVNPFIDRIPIDLHDEYMDAVIDKMKIVCNCKSEEYENFILNVPYTVLVGYAQK